jgi:hypothetical protein
MKRIFLMLIVASGLLVPSMLIVGQAGAANPHDFGEGQNSPGQGGDPNASCSDRPCNSPNLDFSEGCQHGQAPEQNPHCTPPPEPENVTTTPTTPTTAGQPAGGTAGETAAGGSQGAGQGAGPGAAGAAQGGNAAGQLAFTGLDALWLALLGAGLLGSGLVLRTRSKSI